MMNLYHVAFGLFTVSIVAMERNGRQIELCPGRVAYIQKNKQPEPSLKVCVFCDKDILAQNHTLFQDSENDVRILMNKYPYFDFDQGHHLLVMPISHKDHPAAFSRWQLMQQITAAHMVSAQLYPGSYSQEYVTSWRQFAGQSVGHWHSHVKVFTQPPCSLVESTYRYKNSPTNNMEYAFEQVKSKLSSHVDFPVLDRDAMYVHNNCNCCFVKDNPDKDDYNLVVKRFKHHIVCLSHHPGITAEVSIIPYRHVPGLKDLSPEELIEKMTLSMALLSRLREYVESKVSDCDAGGNIYAESMGSESPVERQNNHHFHTRVMPRTDITFPPGTLAGHGCKLDFDPLKLVSYLKENIDDFYLG